MKSLFHIATFIILSIFSSSVAQAADTVTLTLPHSEFGASPSVEVYIEGQGPFSFVIDTGAVRSYITTELANKLGLKIETNLTSNIATINGTLEGLVTAPLEISIGEPDISRQTRLIIQPASEETNLSLGVIGLADLYGGNLVNDPQEKILKINLPRRQKLCDFVTEKDKCESTYVLPLIDIKLGNKEAALIVDTGNELTPPFIMFTNEVNNYYWKKIGEDLPDETKHFWSSKPVKRIRTNDFEFNGLSDCMADFYIRNPHDGSPVLTNRSFGTLGWVVVKKVNFKIDFSTGEVEYPNVCPYDAKNTSGIKWLGYSDTLERAFVQSVDQNSPASDAGLMQGDWIERIILSDGTIIEKFDETFSRTIDQHIYAPEGSSFKVLVDREGVVHPLSIVNRDVTFTSLSPK